MDFDHDGDLDLAFSNVNQPSVLLQNDTQTTGNWLLIELVGTVSNRDAVGATVQLKTNKQSSSRSVIGGGSYLSQGPYYLHFGLAPNETIEQAEIIWPNGQHQTIKNVPTAKRLQWIEPRAAGIVIVSGFVRNQLVRNSSESLRIPLRSLFICGSPKSSQKPKILAYSSIILGFAKMCCCSMMTSFAIPIA